MKKMLVWLITLILSFSNVGVVVSRGKPIPANVKPEPLATLLAKPRLFAGRQIVTEGVVEKACWIAGCWMNVAPSAGTPGLRVTFRGFSIPRNSRGRGARLLGTVKVTGQKATFVADGVELR